MYHKIVSLKLRSVIFSQNYWQNIPKLLIKKPTCFQVSFSTSSSIITITQVFDFYVFKICISYKRHYVKWMVNWWKIPVFKIANKRFYVKYFFSSLKKENANVINIGVTYIPHIICF